MMPSHGVSHNYKYVYKLKKALYGLKQAHCAWFEKFSVVILSLRFVSSGHDFDLFIKCTDAGRIIMSLYVDDIIITSDDIDSISV
jgi:hypothetical protein